MKLTVFGSFLLILVATSKATSESVEPSQSQEVVEVPIEDLLAAAEGPQNADADKEKHLKGDTGDIDYETALKPATHKKRSITNIIKLLVGGNVPPNHPLVKEPESKSWNLAENIFAAAGAGQGYIGRDSGGWGSPTTAEQLQQILRTKAKILPYTGQVASGLIGIGGVKGEILKQIHSLSSAVIAQAAAEAAAKAVASAQAAHAVTSQVAQAAPHVLSAAGEAALSAKAAKAAFLKPFLGNPKFQAKGGAGLGFGKGGYSGGYDDVNQGWDSTVQNMYAKSPGEQAGPPYYPQASSASSVKSQASIPTPAASPDYGFGAMYGSSPQQQFNAANDVQGYNYNLYNNIANAAANDYYTTLLNQQNRQQASASNLRGNVEEPPSLLSSIATLIQASTSAYKSISSLASTNPGLAAATAAVSASAGAGAGLGPASTSNFRASGHGLHAAVSESVSSPVYSEYKPTTSYMGDRVPTPFGRSKSQFPVQFTNPGLQTSSSYVRPTSYSFRSQHVPHNVPQYSPQAFRNPSNAQSILDQAVLRGSRARDYVTATASAGHLGGTRPSSGSFSRYSPESAGSSFVQEVNSGSGSGSGSRPYSRQTAGNPYSTSRTYAKSPSYTTSRQAEDISGPSTNSKATQQTQSLSTARQYSGGVSREAHGPSRDRGSPLTMSQLLQMDYSTVSKHHNHQNYRRHYSPVTSQSQHIPKFELPSHSHSQFNGISNANHVSQSQGRSTLSAKKDLVPSEERMSFTLTIPVQGPPTVLQEVVRASPTPFQSRISEVPSSLEYRYPITLTTSTEDDRRDLLSQNSRLPSLTYQDSQDLPNTPHSRSTSSEEFSSLEGEEDLEDPIPTGEDRIYDLYADLPPIQEVREREPFRNKEQGRNAKSKSLSEIREEERAKSLSRLIHQLMKVSQEER